MNCSHLLFYPCGLLFLSLSIYISLYYQISIVCAYVCVFVILSFRAHFFFFNMNDDHAMERILSIYADVSWASSLGESNTEFPSFSTTLDFWYLIRHLIWIDDCAVFYSSFPSPHSHAAVVVLVVVVVVVLFFLIHRFNIFGWDSNTDSFLCVCKYVCAV